MQEDELTNAIINRPRPEDGSHYAEAKIHPEAHYHHYGARGAVDLYIYMDNYVGAPTKGHLIEIKSEAAVRSVTGANEILRQFNRMREFFFLDESWNVPNSIDYELCFLPTKFNMHHLYKNESMYVSAITRNRSRTDSPDDSFLSSCPVDPNEVSITSRLTVRSPIVNNPTPVNIFTNKLNLLRCHRGGRSFIEYVRDKNEQLYQEHSDALNTLKIKIDD